jgi:hypothetical protein
MYISVAQAVDETIHVTSDDKVWVKICHQYLTLKQNKKIHDRPCMFSLFGLSSAY